MLRRGSNNRDRSLAARELLETLSNIHWHQEFELAPGVSTPGRNPIADVMKKAGVPRSLRGKTVLDIGTWNGGAAFEAERRGADRVLAVDLTPPDVTGFAQVRDFLGSTVEYRVGNVYELSPDEIGVFDYVFLFGVIYHCRHPLLALDRVWTVTGDVLFVESQVLDHALIVDGNELHLADLDKRLPRARLVQYYRRDELAGDSSNWFSPSIDALADWLSSAGYRPELTATWAARCAFRAAKLARPEFTDISSYEQPL